MRSTVEPVAHRPPRGRRRILLLKLALAAASLILSLAFVELGLRWLTPAPRQRLEPQVRYVRVPLDPEHGIAASHIYLEPGQEGYHFEARVKTDRLGFRNDDIPPKEPGQLRIVALGDSHTFGYAVGAEETWPVQLEAGLREALEGRTLDVINGGIEAMAIEQELELLEHRLLEVEPDIVVLAYYWNDMPVEGNPAAPWPDESAPMIPASMRAAASPSTGGAQAAAAHEPSLVEGAIEAVRGAAKQSYLMYLLFQKVPGLQASVSPSNDTFWKQRVLEGGTSPRLDASWRFVERQIERFAALAREHDFEPVLVIVPIFEQMVNDGFSREGYQARMTEICRRRGIHVVDPLDRIRELSPSYPRDFVPFDGHPTGRIYGALAAAVREDLLARPSALEHSARQARGPAAAASP